MIIKNILLLILAMCCIIPLQAAESATAIIDKAASKIKNAKSLTADYTIKADGHSQNGTIIIAGDKFAITSPEISSWYDGRTQWTYSSTIGEVNMTEPTPEELQQVNPFAIISSFKTLYKASLLKSAPGEKKIKLISSNHGSDISEVVLTLNATTLYPTSIELTMSNRRKVYININSVAAGMALPDSMFKYNAKSHPGIPVIDLR